MAAKLLLPGFGGQYVSETFTGVSASSVGADTIDCSHVASLAVGITTGAGSAGTSIILQQTVDGTLWQNLGSAITANSITLLDVTDNPFLRVRIRATITAGTVVVSLTGFPVQVSW